jgi:Raf kinase inhibitor-like YbhB/YbcL family protein
MLSSFSPKGGLTITSKDFTNNGMIPSKYTCEGADINPSLHIADVPAAAKSLALILHDPDAPVKGGFTHWVMWNIPINGEIPENFKGAEQGLNGTGKNGYKGMCPPSGTHHYHFKVYALDTKLNISANTDKTGLEKAMQGHILSEADLIGLYKKTK